jgi:aromatic-L-amino-acid decarboxylase
VAPNISNLNLFNQRLHRRLIRENENLPSTTQIRGQLALRPCFIGARTHQGHADALLDAVLRIGKELENE